MIGQLEGGGGGGWDTPLVGVQSITSYKATRCFHSNVKDNHWDIQLAINFHCASSCIVLGFEPETVFTLVQCGLRDLVCP